MRFEFGNNWKSYLSKLDDARIAQAEKSLKEYLNCSSLENKRFIDIGCGSGLFSLAARRMGAEVFSFDYDQNSVECALQLKNNFFKNDEKWVIEQGDILSEEYLNKLGKFDIVYSWGVLHHTGNMYKAFQNVATLGKPQSKLFIAIYNDQGNASKRWKWIKEQYNKGGMFQRSLLAIYTLFRQWTITFCRDTLKHFNTLKSWNEYSKMRGMSPWHDIVDWVGGYPFEVAKPEEVLSFFQQHGFNLMKLKTCAGGLGCNEFVFNKN